MRPSGVATGRLGPESSLRVVDALVTGTHEPDTSHYQALHAFAGGARLRRMTEELETNGYRTHEFGDSVLIERQAPVGTDCRRQCSHADGESYTKEEL